MVRCEYIPGGEVGYESRTENHDLRAGGITLGVETHHDEKLPPYVGAVMIVAGLGLIAAQKLKG